MKGQIYRQYLQKYVSEAVRNSDGSNRGISEYLENIPEAGKLSRHREEKNRARQDALNAFSENRHWPVEITLSHLGVKPEDS